MEVDKVTEHLEQLQTQIQEARGTYRSLAEKKGLTAEILTELQEKVLGNWLTYQDQHLTLLALTRREQRYVIPHFRDNRLDVCEESFTELAADITDALLSIRRNTIIKQTEPTPMMIAQSMKETKFQIEVELPPLSDTYAHSESQAKIDCHLCNKNHIITHCRHFGRMSLESRCEYAKQTRLCFNCLQPGHSVYYCKRRKTCEQCTRRLHIVLPHTKERKRKEPHDRDRVVEHTHAEVTFKTQQASVEDGHEKRSTDAPHFTKEMRSRDIHTQHRSEADGTIKATNIHVSGQEKIERENDAAEKENKNQAEEYNTSEDNNEKEQTRNTNIDIHNKWPFDPLGGKCVRENSISWIEGQRMREETERVELQYIDKENTDTVEILIQEIQKYESDIIETQKHEIDIGYTQSKGRDIVITVHGDKAIEVEDSITQGSNLLHKKKKHETRQDEIETTKVLTQDLSPETRNDVEINQTINTMTRNTHIKLQFDKGEKELGECKGTNKTDYKRKITNIANEKQPSEAPHMTCAEDRITVTEKVKDKQTRTIMDEERITTYIKSLVNEEKHDYERSYDYNELDQVNEPEIRENGHMKKAYHENEERPIAVMQKHEYFEKDFNKFQHKTNTSKNEEIENKNLTQGSEFETVQRNERIKERLKLNVGNETKLSKENDYIKEECLASQPVLQGSEEEAQEEFRKDRQVQAQTHTESLHGGLPLKLCHIFRELQRVRRLKVPPDKPIAEEERLKSRR